MNIKRRIAFTLGTIAFIAFIIGLSVDSYVLRMVSKPWPALLMALIVLDEARSRYARLVGFGLGACVLGDVLLETSEATFLPGVGAFLIGHLLYIGAYSARTARPHPERALVPAVWGVGMMSVLWDGLGPMQIPVAVYTAAICAMMWRALAMWDKSPNVPATIAAIAGALLFGISDSIIAINKFYAPFESARYFIIILYWIGQLGITWSALSFEADEIMDVEAPPTPA